MAPARTNSKKSTSDAAKENRRPQSSTRVEDSDRLTRLEATIREQRAQIDKMLKEKEVKEKTAATKKPSLIQRPKGKISGLQSAMGMSDDDSLYNKCRALVRKAVTRSDLDPGKDWRRQTPNQVAKVIQAIHSKEECLTVYVDDWATLELIRTALKNIRDTNARLARKAAKTETRVSGSDPAPGEGDGEDVDEEDRGEDRARCEDLARRKDRARRDASISSDEEEKGSSSSEDSLDGDDEDNQKQKKKRKYSAVRDGDEDEDGDGDDSGKGKKRKKRKVNPTRKSTRSHGNTQQKGKGKVVQKGKEKPRKG